jgi:hypothetical protein
VSVTEENAMGLQQPGDIIPVVTVDFGPIEGEKGIFSGARDVAARVANIDATSLGANLSAFCSAIWKAIDNVPVPHGTFRLDSFEVTADLTASGEVRLVGSVRAQASGGIKLVFTRTPQTKSDQ